MTREKQTWFKPVSLAKRLYTACYFIVTEIVPDFLSSSTTVTVVEPVFMPVIVILSSLIVAVAISALPVVAE